MIAALFALHLASALLQNAGEKPGLPYNHELLDKLKDPSAATRREAALDLAKMGADGRAAVPDLAKLLIETDAGVRAAASFALGEIGLGALDAAPALARNVTSDKDTNVRKEGAAAIGKIGPKAIKTLPILLKSLRQESDADVRDAIGNAIARVGPQAKETHTGLAEALADPSPEIRVLAAATLGKIGPAARPVLAAVEKATKDNVTKVAEAAQAAQLRINGEIEEPAPVNDAASKFDLPEWNAFSMQDLLNLLKSPTPSTRQKAIYQLVKRRKEIDQPKLIQTVSLALSAALKDDAEPGVRAAAAYALGHMPQFNADLPRGLADYDTTVRVESARSLGILGAKSRAAVRPLAQSIILDAAGPVRATAAGALRLIEKEFVDISKAASREKNDPALQSLYQEIVKTLLDGITKPDEEVRARVAMTLGEYGPNAKDAAAPLCQLLKDPFNYVRVAAAGALGELGPEARQKAEAPLEELSNDKDPRVRKRAKEALARLGKDTKKTEPEKPLANNPPPQPAAETPASQPAAPAEPVNVKDTKPKPAAGSLEAGVAELLDGEGGICDPSYKVDNNKVILILQLAHDRFDEGMSHGDAVRLSLKLLIGVDTLQELTVHVIAHNGSKLRAYRVTRERAAPFFEKGNDPFERRRARDWWPQMASRIAFE